MAQQLFFSRDSKLYVEFDSKLWEVPVLDGFSFSQSTNTSDITLAEMQGADGISRRGRRLFTDSLAPAEWSFSTYVRPFFTSTEHHAVEEVLWAVMAGADKYGTIGTAGAISAVDFSAADSAGDRDPGTYVIDLDDCTGTHAGTGGTIQIIVNSAGNANDVQVVSGGKGYTAAQTIIVPTALIGDGTGSITIDIDSVDDDATTGFYRNVQADSNSDFGTTVAMPTIAGQTINFGQSNRAVLATCNLYFVMETSTTKPMVYKLENAQINEASVDFDVDGIATINWSGFAKNIIDKQSQGKVTVQSGTTITGATVGDLYLDSADDLKLGIATGATTLESAIDAGVDQTSAFIRNRLTQCIVSTTDTTAFPSGDYSLTLTGGNVTVSNNITYLVPEELGNVNIPIEGVTGGRTVTGNFTCYLTLDTDATALDPKGSSVELFNNMTTSGQGLDKVVNDFQVTFQIGGAVDGNPRLYIAMPKVHIDVPVHSVEDVISLETGFGAYTNDFDNADEIVLTYYGNEDSGAVTSYP